MEDLTARIEQAISEGWRRDSDEPQRPERPPPHLYRLGFLSGAEWFSSTLHEFEGEAMKKRSTPI
jgi:hypothetical protein